MLGVSIASSEHLTASSCTGSLYGVLPPTSFLLPFRPRQRPTRPVQRRVCPKEGASRIGRRQAIQVYTCPVLFPTDTSTLPRLDSLDLPSKSKDVALAAFTVSRSASSAHHIHGTRPLINPAQSYPRPLRLLEFYDLRLSYDRVLRPPSVLRPSFTTSVCLTTEFYDLRLSYDRVLRPPSLLTTSSHPFEGIRRPLPLAVCSLQQPPALRPASRLFGSYPGRV
jgi:hypothetical protein